MLWDRCPVCLSVTLLYCGQTVGWIKIKLGTEVGLDPRRHCDIVLDGDPAPPLKKGHSSSQFSTNICYDQTAGWVKMPLVMEVSLGPGHIVLDGDPVPPKGHSPQFAAHVCCSQTSEWIKMSYCVRWGPSSPKRGTTVPLLFGPCLLWRNGRPSQLC